MSQFELTLGTSIPHNKPVTLRGVDAARHLQIMGITGSGKNGLQESLVLQRLNQGGTSVFFQDSAGDSCDKILRTLFERGFFTNPQAYRRLLYIDFTDQRYSVPFNVLSNPGYDSYTKAGIVAEAFRRAFGHTSSSAPMLEQVLLASSFVLSENGEPLTQLQTLLNDGTFRARMLQRIQDPQMLSFFSQFGDSGKHAGGMSESMLRRVFLISFSPVLRGALDQRDNILPFRRLMDEGVSVLFNLGGLESEVQRLLGCLISIGIEEAALSRSDIPEERRRPCTYILDEWPLYAAQSGVALERIMSLARKYKLSLVLANQHLGQVSTEMRLALQNAIPIFMRLGRDDAEWAAQRIASYDPTLTKQDPTGDRVLAVSASEQQNMWTHHLMTLPPREALIRLVEHTVQFRTLTIPSPSCSDEQLAAIKEHYAQILLTPRSKLVEVETASPQTEPASPSPKSQKRQTEQGPKRHKRFERLKDEEE